MYCVGEREAKEEEEKNGKVVEKFVFCPKYRLLWGTFVAQCFTVVFVVVAVQISPKKAAITKSLAKFRPPAIRQQPSKIGGNKYLPTKIHKYNLYEFRWHCSGTFAFLSMLFHQQKQPKWHLRSEKCGIKVSPSYCDTILKKYNAIEKTFRLCFIFVVVVVVGFFK